MASRDVAHGTVRIVIPAGDRDRLARLLELQPQELEALADAMKGAGVHLSHLALARDLVDRVKLDRADVSELVQLILTLYSVRDSEGFSAAQMAEQLANAAQATDDERLKAPTRGWQELKDELAQLLSFDQSLGLTSKAVALAYEAPQHLHGVRVLTDARPLFTGQPEAGPAAFLITHTLKLDVNRDGEDREIFVTLYADDLLLIREAVDRALAKEDSLRLVLAKTGVAVLKAEQQ